MRVIFVSQVEYYSDFDRYGRNFYEIGWEAEEKTQYAYFLADDILQPEVGGPYQLPSEVETYVTDEEFVAVAVGNIDEDDELDVWTIDQDKNLVNVIDDVTNSRESYSYY